MFNTSGEDVCLHEFVPLLAMGVFCTRALESDVGDALIGELGGIDGGTLVMTCLDDIVELAAATGGTDDGVFEKTPLTTSKLSDGEGKG